MADRLARVLFGQRADQALLNRAAAVKDNAGVQALAREMLRDARAVPNVRAIMRRWLALEGLSHPGPTPVEWPALVRETDEFVTRMILSEDGSLSTLLTAPFTFVDDPRLATYYGAVAGLGPDGRIIMDPRQQRSGILTHGSLLMANPRATVRGIWLRRGLLCQEIPPAPNDIALPPPVQLPMATYRQRLTAATTPPTCMPCHRLTDPPAFALERFDDVGHPRELDQGLPIDDSGSLEISSTGGGTITFKGAQQLGAALASHCEVRACVVRSFLSQALGGELRAGDEESRSEIAAAFVASGANLRELLIAVLGSKAFLAP